MLILHSRANDFLPGTSNRRRRAFGAVNGSLKHSRTPSQSHTASANCMEKETICDITCLDFSAGYLLTQKILYDEYEHNSRMSEKEHFDSKTRCIILQNCHFHLVSKSFGTGCKKWIPSSYIHMWITICG